MSGLAALGLAVLLFSAPGFALRALGQITLPGTQPGDIVNWPLELPSSCKGCHGDYVAGLDYEPFDTWSGTMMANSARDPLFWAAVDIANQDAPGAGELCIRCHSPRGWLAGRSSTPDGSALLGYPDEPDNDFEGIDCHFCHRMYEGPGGINYTENGQYWVDDGAPGSEPPRRGPYDDANGASHPWAYSNYHQSSEFCGTCHDLRNPLTEFKDENGQGLGTDFPEQTTYSEWEQSAFAVEGTSCQDCHMPAVQGFACDDYDPLRNDIFRHDFAGANTFVPQILRGEYGSALGRTDSYSYTIAQALEMLQNQSATVQITAPINAVEDQELHFSVRVTNNTGHKLPTGYPEGRRMWLHVEARDALGNLFFESGAYDDLGATLTVDPQLHVYETHHGVHGDGPGFHLALNDRIFFDNRIPPRGFVPDIETQPVGAVYPDQGGGVLAHWSDVDYVVPVPLGVAEPIDISATLRYQTSSRDYIEFLRDENVSGPDPKDRNYPLADSRGQKIYDFWSNYGKSAPVDMTSDGVSLPVVMGPGNVTNFQAVPDHNQVQLSWDMPGGDVAGVRILRKGWGDYPEFGDLPGAIAPPSYLTTMTTAVSAGWVEIYDGLGTSFTDTGFDDASRDVPYYAAYVYDSGGAPASGTAAAQTRATSYRLGDLGEIGLPGVFDGLIDGVKDLPVLSLCYGTAGGEAGYDAACDIGPTHDGTSTGIPLTDDLIDFSDLVVFALQFGTTGPSKAPIMARSSSAPIRLELGPSEPSRDGLVRVPLRMTDGAGRTKALSIRIENRALAERAVAFEPGPVALRVPAPHFAAPVRREGRLSLDLALLGAGAVLPEDGIVAYLVIPEDQLGRLESAPLSAELRDAAGAWMPSQIEFAKSGGDQPHSGRLSLSQNVPNPFNPKTSLQLRVPTAGRVEVTVYDVAGRRVSSLLRGHLDAGVHSLEWDGTDAHGRAVASGMYLCRAEGPGGAVTQRMALVR